MAHNIQKRDIQTGLTLAWHKLTNLVAKITRDNSGIIYPMEKRQMHILGADGLPVYKEEEILDKKGNVVGTKTVPACEFHQIVSLDDGLPIGNPVKAGYQLISNGEMYDLIESALAGTAHEIVSIGSVGNRERVYASIKLSADVMAGNRQTQNVLNVIWGHGGVFGVTARSCMTVVVCQNTLNMALSEKNEFRIDAKHTGNASVKLANMGKAIDAHYGVVNEFKLAMDSLESQAITENSAKEIFAGFIVRENDPEEISTRSANTIDTIQTLFRTGKGNSGKTFCDAFNALTDYYTHESSGGDDKFKQFESSEFGAGNRLKTEAFELFTGNRVAKLGDLAEVSARGNKVLQLI